MVTNVLKTPTMSLEAVDIREHGLSACQRPCMRMRAQEGRGMGDR